MRKSFILLLMLLTACQAFQPTVLAASTLVKASPSPTVASSATATALPTATPTHRPTSTLAPTATHPFTATPEPAATDTPQASPTVEPSLHTITNTTQAPAAFSVRFHPDGPLYVGDQVSIEVIAQPGMNLKEHKVQITSAGGKLIGEAGFEGFGIASRPQATLYWDWNTSGLPAGEQSLSFSILPDGPHWSETVNLLPAGQAPDAQAHWATVRTACCTVNYVTGTAAERDLPQLLKMVDQQARDASQRMGVGLDQPIEITFLPRVLGHGGFARQGIDVSYLDRNYAGGNPAIIIHHEIIHILDGRLGGDLRPSALVEGLAVYESGGHYKYEPLMPRAAALLPAEAGCTPWSAQTAVISTTVNGCGLGSYVPLDKLFDNFYFEQHETGYLEAGSLIEYMSSTWGWPEFSAFYRDIHPLKDATSAANDQTATSRAVDAALQKHFGISLAQLDQQFQAALRAEALTPALSEDVRVTFQFYDSMRRYQQILDASAYFMTAWLPDDEQMRQRGIVADYLRHPEEPVNQALETLLAAANTAWLKKDYSNVERLLTALNAVLDDYPSEGVAAVRANPVTSDYLTLVNAVRAMGYRPEYIQIENETARVWVNASGPAVIELAFKRYPSGWHIVQEAALASDVLTYYGQDHKMPPSALKGAWQYRFMVSNATAVTTRQQRMMTRQPQPARTTLRVVLFLRGASSGGAP
jgi:hypothetical protein